MAGLTGNETARIAELHEQGWSVNRIARELDRAPSTISRYARRANLSFAREQTQAAVAAHTIDLAERRSRAAERLAADAERMQDQLFASYTAWSFGGRENIYREHRVAEPDAQTKLNIMRSISTAWTTSMRLSEFSEGSDTSGARSLLGGLASAFAAAADALPPDENDAGST